MSKKDSDHPIQEKNGKKKGKPIDPFLALRLHRGEPFVNERPKGKKMVRGPVSKDYKKDKKASGRGIVGTIAGKSIGSGQFAPRSQIFKGGERSEMGTKFKRGGMSSKAGRVRRSVRRSSRK